MKVHAHEISQRLKATDHALCLELCPRTLEESHYARLHLHLFVRGQQRMYVSGLEELAFEGIRPAIACMIGGLSHRADQARGSYAGMFYCLVAKKGQIFQHGTKAPFKDFLIQGSWVMNLLQASKISTSLAKSLLLQTCSSQGRFAKEIAAVEAMEERALVAHAISEAHAALATTIHAFKTIPAVESWKSQYLEHAYRYKLLVLEGPSKMGKTLYARSLCPPGRQYLEVNCAAGEEPDLREFRFSKHGLVIFDEINPKTVIRQRKLFQGGPVEVQLGCSTTNCFAYTICLYQVRLVLCSNVWTEQLSELLPDDAAWLSQNIYHVAVQEPLWQA